MGGNLNHRPVAYLDRLSAVLDCHRQYYLIWFSMLYLLFIGVDAATKPLWFDEFFTLYISRLPHLTDIWVALASGRDANPPLSYWLTHCAFSVFGVNHLSARAPNILGFLLMSVCVFRFVGKRCPSTFAAAAMLLPLLTGAYAFADEARPYGLVLGFAGLALVLWQEAVECERRTLSLAALSLTVAAAVWSHYYAVFIVFPIVLGEASRWWTSKRFDRGVCLSLASGIASLLLLFPLLRSVGFGNFGVYSRSLHSASFFSKPGLSRMIATYSALLAPAIPALLAALALLALTASSSRRLPDGRAEDKLRLPMHETIAAAGFASMPIVLTIFTKCFTGYYFDRYAVSAVIGIAILFGFVTAYCFRKPAEGMLLTILLAAAFVAIRGWEKIEPMIDSQAGVSSANVLDANGDSSLPIAVANPLIFAQFSYYAPPNLASRLVYLSCPSVAVTYPDFIPDMSLLSLRKSAPMRVEEYKDFLLTHRHFRVYYTSNDQMEWLVPQLLHDGYTVRLVAKSPGASLFDVSAGAD